MIVFSTQRFWKVVAGCSNYENAEYVFNLNNEVDNLKRKIWFRLYGGTLEHVFNFSIFKKYLKILKKWLYYAFSPANNLVDHGFYMFSPTAYYDFYSNNNFQIINACQFLNMSKMKN